MLPAELEAMSSFPIALEPNPNTNTNWIVPPDKLGGMSNFPIDL